MNEHLKIVNLLANMDFDYFIPGPERQLYVAGEKKF